MVSAIEEHTIQEGTDSAKVVQNKIEHILDICHEIVYDIFIANVINKYRT